MLKKKKADNIFAKTEKLLSKGGKATPNSKNTGKARPIAMIKRFRAANEENN